MKAMVCSAYGPPERLELRDLPTPVPGEKEVLIRVQVTAVNDYDWAMVRGKPWLYRLLFGLTRPKNPVPGMELSGIIEALGPGASRFQVGDAVFGDISGFGFGSFAEYLCIHEDAVIAKPPEIGFVDAAALPHASLLAWQGLVELGGLREGQTVLINGAGGGVGTFGLQLAKLYGAEVTGVDTGKKLEMMKALGFDRVTDYRQEDFTRSVKRYDLILDTKTGRSPFAYARALKPGGVYVTVGGQLPRLMQLLLLAPWISRIRTRSLRLLALKPNKGLPEIIRLYQDHKLKCVVDGPYTLEEAPAALRYFGEGKHSGKVILRN